MFLLPDVDIRILWGTFWGLTGVMAHLFIDGTRLTTTNRSLGRSPLQFQFT